MSNMLLARILELTVSTQGDLMEETAILTLGLKQGTSPSPILFLLYIDHLTEFFKRKTDYEV